MASMGLWSTQTQGATGTWILNNAGNWTGTPANWQGGITPNGAGDIAIIRNDITANRTITLNAPITLGGLHLGDSLGGSIFTFAGTNALTLNNGGSNAFVNKYSSATDVWQTPLVLTSNTNWNIYTGTLDVTGVSNAVVSYTGAGNTIKGGAGALRLNIDAASGAGYTGNWVMNFGTLNIGGANNATPTSLGTGTGGITLNGMGSTGLTVFSLNNNGAGSNGTITYSGNNDVIVQGAATINVDRNYISAANTGNTIVLDNLTMNGGVLGVTGANGYALAFNGTTTLVGDTNVFAPSSATISLNGVITDGASTRALIKEGTGRLAIGNAANTYDGVTAIKDGIVQLNTGASLGTGAVYVNGGTISLASAAQAGSPTISGGLNLVGALGTSRFALPVVANRGFTIDAANPLNVTVPVSGMNLAIDGTVTNNIDMNQVGSGNQRVWLSNVTGGDHTYRGTLTNSVSGDLRLTSGSNNLILDTNANILGGAGATNNLVFGFDYNNPINLTGNNITHANGGTISVRVDNANTLGTVTVNRGVTLNINGAVTTPVGAGIVTALGGTISTDNTTAAKFGNTDFRLYGGSTLLLDNSAVTTANTDRRLINTSTIGLTSSTLRLIGDGATASVTTSQTVGSISYQGGSTISVDLDATTGTGRLATLTAGSLNRTGQGTLNVRNISNIATTFGTAAATQKLIISSAPTVTNDMIGANVVLWGGANANDGGTPLFATYDGTHGLQAAIFDITPTTPATLQAATAGQIVDWNNINGTQTLTANATMQALRLRTTANTQVLAGGGFTITLGSTAGAGQGAGLFLSQTAGNGVTHSPNFAFGSQEGLIYAATPATNGSITLSGAISGSNGVTRFGDGILILSGTNTFTGPFTQNAGETRLSRNAVGNITAASGSINPATAGEINLWGGALYLNEASQRMNANATFYNDTRFGNANVIGAALNNITVAARTGSTAPVVAWVQNQGGSNFTTAYGGLTLNGPVQLSVVHALQVNGPISGTGSIDKFMNERLQFGADSSGYSQPINVYAGSLYSINANSAAKPFGTGAVTINPGSSIMLAAETNVNVGQLAVKSDLGGISGITLSYTGDPASVPATVTSTAPWKGYLGVAGAAFDYNLDQSASGLWGGGVYLGAPLGLTGTYTGTLTPTASNQFLLGTGQGAIRIANPLTGGNSVVIGLSMTGMSRADQTVNNSGGAVNFDMPMTYTGTTTVNPNISLRITAPNALTGTGNIILNGGTLRPENATAVVRTLAPITLTNNIILTADSNISIDDSAVDFRLGGNISLAPGSTGVVRQLSVSPGQPGGANNNAGIVYLDGGVSDGAGGSGNHFVKAGLGVAMVTGPMTYTGTTTITGGLLGINGDADLASSSDIKMVNGGLAIWENSFTTDRNYSAHGGNAIFDVAGGLTLTQSANSVIDGTSSIVKRGLGTMILNGTNAVTGLFAGDGVLQFNSQASLGDAATTSNFSIGGDVTTGGATVVTRYTGGTMRINFTGATNRGMVFNNNGNTNFSGGMDITAGNTFTLNGVVSQGSELDYGFKTGAGTLITAGANTMRQFAMTNGTLQFGNSAPWANSTTTATDNTVIEMLGGTIRAVNTGANIALANAASTTTYNYGGGMHLRLESGGAFSAELQADNLLRVNQGTLVIETAGGTTLGASGSNTARVIVTNAINSGVARASALTNGIFAPHLLGADANGSAFFLENNATTGFQAYSGAVQTTLAGLNPTAIGDITTDPALTGSDNSIYAFRTTSDISGGTLKITAIDNQRMGGVLINGSNTISSNLVFDPTSATAPGTGTPAEGLIYVKTGENATVSGNVTANALTKFGKGTLTISGSNMVASELSVQEGTLKLGSGNPLSRMNTELNLNAGATLDLNGNSVAVETVGGNNRQVDTNRVGGEITNSSGTQATLAVASPVNSTFDGVINQNVKLDKSGVGTLTINGFSASTPDAGNNTYTGGTNIYGYNTTGGINVNNTTFAFGGASGSPAGDVNLYSGTLGLLFSNGTTGVNGTNGMQFNNQVVKFGPEAGLGYTLNVKGPALITVNQSTPSSNTAFGQGNIMQVGALNLTNSTLQLSGGNLYRLRVAGTTTIQGAQATIQLNTDSGSGLLELAGQVTGSGALNKTGDGTMRALIISGTTNDYSGGTNIISGDLQVTGTTGTPLGSGAVRVFPDGTLRIAGNGSITGANLQVMSRVNALGAVALDDNFSPTALTSTNFSSVYNTTLQLSQPYFNQALNMATIGDGRAFLGNAINSEVKYMAATLGAGAEDAWNPGVGVYRVVGGVTTFAFDGVDNVLTGSAYLQAGPQRNMVFGAITNAGSTVVIRNSNNFSGGTQVTEGLTLAVETGGSPISETPLGTGAIEVYGTLTYQGSLGSNWSANNAAAISSDIKLRPGGTVRLIDGNQTGSGGNVVAGNQGRWGDTVGIDLNGGTFRFDGASNWNSVETIGTVDVRKGGTITVARATTASSAQLNVGGLNRIAGGTLSVTYNTGFLGTNLVTPLSYERLTVASGVTLGGTTTNGTGVVNGGIAPVWIVDATTNSYLGYNPTGTGTGFQPLISGAPGAGQIAYNKIVSGALTAGGLVSGDIADITTGAKTLADNPTLHALRSNQSISPTAGSNTITLESGGAILTGGTINPTGAITSGVVSPMTINFGSAGAGEGILYVGGNTTVQARMVAALGITKFGGSTLTVNSINPGIGGPVTINAGTIIARVPFSGTGTALATGVFNGQDIILNGGGLQLDPFLANAAGTASEIASNVRAMATFDSNIIVRGDSSLNNNSQATYVHIKDLTFQNGGGAAAMDGNGVIALALQNGIWVDGTTTLIPQAVFNMTFNNFAQSTFGGKITGAADLEKFGNGTMTLLNATNDYSGGTLIWGTTNATAASVVASGLRGAGTPFGTGAVTVQPGGMLRIADTANIASNAVTLRSDGYGLAGLGIAYDGPLPTIITSGTPTAGQVKVETTGPFGAVLGLDYGYYSQPLDMATVGNGDWWLGGSQSADTYYFNGTLGAGSGGKYLLGGGGSQTIINFGSVSVGNANTRTPLFENIFGGGAANSVRIEVGALTADLAANGPSFVNGNIGIVVMPTRNTTLTGDVRVNTNSTLALGNNFALGNGRLVMNGGNLRYDFGSNNWVTSSITMDNNVLLQGDWSTSSGNELVINGNVAMHDGTAGATRIWNLTGSGAMAVGLAAGSSTNGVISGNDGSNLIKRGAQVVSFRGMNTYQGYTQIDRGEINVVGDVLPGVAGPLGVSTSPIILGVESTNNAGSLGIGGKYTVGRDIAVTAAPGTGLNLIEARTNERAIVTGGISVASGAILTLGAVSGSHATGSGGVLEIQGPISGAGAVVFGTGAAATSFGGTVSLSGNVNGYGINTYSGGTTFNSTRVEIGGDTLYSGPASNPAVISGPFGTGALTFTSGENTNGWELLAIGGPRTIVNAINATSSDANATFKFMGSQALTFTRNWDLHSGVTLRNRTFQVSNPYQPVTFSGNLSNSGAQGSNVLKTGTGLLVLTGTNSQANLLTTDGNYGTGVFIDNGILRVNADAALGSTTSLAAGGAHLVGPADVRLRGGVLSISSSFTTARQIILVAASGIDVASGQTLTLSTQTAGVFGITKTGPGTLALNNGANTITTLTLGGAQQLNPNVGLYSNTGGTVSTTATTGTPFGTSSVTINSGTLSLADAAVQTLSIPTITYGAAGQIATSAGDTLTASTAFTRSGAYNSVNYGTLVINPSALANLASTEKLLVTTGAPANTTLTGGDILSIPSVLTALAGAGQDADFVRYDATNGFAPHTVTTVTTLATTAATNVGDISTADTVGAATNDIIDIGALRTSANISGFDSSVLLRINNGGLIINGSTAPTISTNVLFGTGAGLKEAIVYVRDSQTGVSSISGNITALDFTKTGPGLLELSGSSNQLNPNNTARLPVLSVQNGTLRFATSGARFSNASRPSGVNTVLGNYVLNVNEGGVFDLNGVATTIGGLNGNGTISSGVAGSAALTAANGFGVDTTFNGFIADGSGAVSFTKLGNGILTLAGASSYSGGTTVQAGRVTSSIGSTGALGRLEGQKTTSFGTGPITLAGGTLTMNATTFLNSAQTTNDVSDGIDVLTWGGANGYDITIANTASTNGTALPANITSTLNAGTQNAAINSLTVNAPMLTSTAGLIMVKGATTFSQSETVVRTAGGRLFLQGQVNATGNTIIKTGANDLVLSNTDLGAGQSQVGGWKVYGGILNLRSADGGSNPLGANQTVELNGGSTSYGLLLNTDGDGTAAAERVITYADTTVRFGSPLPVSSNQFVSSSGSRIGVDRILGNNDDKTVVIKALEIRGALGSPYTYFVNGNSANLWVDQTTTFERDWTLQIDGTNMGLTLNGVVSGNGTLNRRSNGGTLYLNAVNTYNGGTFFTASGRNYLGSFEGNQVTLSNTAKLGTGHVFMGPLATFQINDAGNLRSDQNFYVSGNLSWSSTLSLAADLSLDTVRLRALGLGGIQNSATDYFLSAANPSNGVLALGTIYTQPLNMRALGDGMWWLGSTTNGVGANGAYDAATLAPGLGDTYRLGAGGSTLFFGTNGNANVLTDNDPTCMNNLVIGTPMTVQNMAAQAGGTGTVVLLQNQNYTGTTLINRGSTLDFRGTLTTSSMEVYGTVNVAGEAGTFINPTTSANIPVTLRPGSTIRLDNTTAGVLPTTATQGRWQDSVALDMHDAIFRLQGNTAVEVSETVGAINANKGTNQLQVVRGVAGRGVELVTSAINRTGNATVQLGHTAGQLGTDERVKLVSGSPTITNGMVAPWMISATDNQFLTYNTTTGFTLAGFDRVQAAATLAATVSAPNDRTFFSGAVVLNAGVDFEAYALRLDGNVTLGTATDNTAQLIIGSGGLISNGTRTITAGVVAGSIGTPGELLIYNNGTTAIGEFANPNTAGQILASGITKFGGGTLQFLGNNAGFTGDIRLQQGTVELNYRNTTDVATNVTTTIGGNGGNIIFEGAGTQLNLLGGQGNTAGTNFTGTSVQFNKGVVIADYVPLATIVMDRSTGSAATAIQNKMIILNGGLTFGANNGDNGQVLRILGNNGYDLTINGTTTLNGRSSFAVDTNYSGVAVDVFLAGQVTGTGTLVKGASDSRTGSLNLRNITTLNDFSGGVVHQGGTLQSFARATNVAASATANITAGGMGTGSITLMGGLLDLRVDNDVGTAADTNLERTVYASTGALGPNVIVNGSSIINVDRNAAGTTKQIVLGNLTIGSQQLTVTGTNSYSLEIGGTTTLLGNAFFNNGTDFVLNGTVNTDGGAAIINKIGTSVLWVNSNNNTLAANTYVNAGLLAFGNRLTGNTSATLGIGDIFVNPGAQIQVRGTGNINTGLGQQVVLTGTPYSPSIFRAAAAFTQANYQSLIQNTTPTSNQVAYISFEATPSAANLDQSLIGNGRMYFGAISGDRTYGGAAAGSALTPGLANLSDSVVGGTSTNRVYRLGGGDTTARTLIINLTAAGAGLGDVGGATDVQIGSLATLGPSGNFNTGFVYFQDQNTYTGQTVISRGMTLRFNTAMNVGDTAGPLGANGSALVDVYGGLRSELNSTLMNNAGSAQFYSNVNFHPGSLLVFQDAAASGNRWDNTTALNLDGSAVQVVGGSNVNLASEAVGDLTFDRGSRVYLNSAGTGDAIFTASSVTRASASTGAGTGRGTLIFVPAAVSRLGIADTSNNAEQAIFTSAPTVSATSAVASMLPGYYMDGQAHRFVTYGAAGTTGVAPVADGSMVAFSAGMTAGTAVVNVNATTTLPDFNPVIYALRGGAFTLNSPTGANNDATITFGGSGADVGAVASFGAFVINPNLKFGASGTNEAIFYTGSTLTVNGNITAGSITKYGTGGTLVIANDQSAAARGTGNGYSGGWVVNEGALQFGQFGSAGNAVSTNTIVLNGSQAASAQLNLRAQPADSLLNYTYTSGKIYAVDNATIDWDPGADDRVHTIADIEIQQSGGIGNGVINGTNDAILRIVNNRNRSILSAGTLTLASNAILNVDTTAGNSVFNAYANNGAYLTNGISSGMSVAALSGSDRLTKWGDGYLYIRGNSSGFSGSVVIDQGAIQVNHNGSLGSGAVTVNRYGTLDINVAGYTPTNSSITYNQGSMERWSVDGARSGAVNLGAGTLQVAANQPTTIASVTLNGGGIEAWLRSDDLNAAQAGGGVMRILNSNVTFTLAGDSFIGTRYYEGANGLDMGRQSFDNNAMVEYTASGAILEVQGAISGTGGLTKVGYDTVILSGANTYSGTTVVAGGKLMIGRDDALPVTTTLTSTANGVLDLNGQNQTVGVLNNVVTTTAVNSTSGFITNSATTVKTLTVGNGTSSDFTYSGVIQHNVALAMAGTGKLTLNNANTYTGKTTITSGTVALGVNATVNDTPWIAIGSNATFDVSAKSGGYTFDGKISGGGTDVAGTTFATVTNAAKINGSITVGDHIGEVCLVGTMAPGGSSVATDITTAGNQIGHVYTSGDLTLSGGLTSSSPVVNVDRLSLQLNGATNTLAGLGWDGSSDMTAFIDGLAGGTTLQQNTLNGLAGSLTNHDYVNIGGAFSVNANGRITVTNFGTYTPHTGDLFNLLDWVGALGLNSFNINNGSRMVTGAETNTDLDLPTLGAGMWWDTSLFQSHGVVAIVPEPGRVLLMLLGLLMLGLRRRRQM